MKSTYSMTERKFGNTAIRMIITILLVSVLSVSCRSTQTITTTEKTDSMVVKSENVYASMRRANALLVENQSVTIEVFENSDILADSVSGISYSLKKPSKVIRIQSNKNSEQSMASVDSTKVTAASLTESKMTEKQSVNKGNTDQNKPYKAAFYGVIAIVILSLVGGIIIKLKG